eukprot:TRINITY_DN4787_c0_g1_i1.p1 TRINITY_DN4787_c0_g1~~TRINITY_DN4787_c0_g1_i1.p1  ORF type:complete len:714 (-),score=140.45 TRINITY_DN4787_c0_g1_i1:91-2232(-)
MSKKKKDQKNVHNVIDLESNSVSVNTDEKNARVYIVPNLRSYLIQDLYQFLHSDYNCPVAGNENTVLYEWSSRKKPTLQLDPTEQVTSLYDRWNKDSSHYHTLLLCTPEFAANVGRYKKEQTNMLTAAANSVGKVASEGGKLVAKAGKTVIGAAENITAKRGRGNKEKETQTQDLRDMEREFMRIKFGTDGFSTEQYVDSLFRQREPVLIKSLLDTHITKSRQETARILKNYVHANYPKFIDTSNEIEHLEQDMLELRNQLNEFNSLLKGMNSVNFHVSKSWVPRKDAKLGGNLLNSVHTLLELPDELDILTSERLFEEAIGAITHARNLVRETPQLATAEASIKEDLDRRIHNLSNTLIMDLQNPAIKKRESQKIIDYLHFLGFASKAREVFLQTRSRQLKNELRKLNFDGDVFSYVDELSRVVFSSINITSEDFKHSFSQKDMMSAFVVWATKVLKQYRALFTRHVFHTTDVEDFAMMARCLEVCFKYCIQLENKGYSFSFFLKEAFHDDLLEAIQSFQKRVETSINGQLTEEKWECRDLITADKKVLRMTESGIYVYNILVERFRHAIPILNPESSGIVATVLNRVLENYMMEMLKLLEDKNIKLPYIKYLGIIANAVHVSNELVDQFIHHMDDVEGMDSAVEEVHEKCVVFRAIAAHTVKLFCETQAEDIVSDPTKLNWNNTKYDMVKCFNNNNNNYDLLQFDMLLLLL